MECVPVECVPVEVCTCGGVYLWRCVPVKVCTCEGVYLWRCVPVEVCTCGGVYLWSVSIDQLTALPHMTGAQTFYRVAKCFVGTAEQYSGGLRDKSTTICLLVNVCMLIK